MNEFRPASQKLGPVRKWACAAAALAGLTGASGVILAAAAAHAVPDQRLQTAANFLLIHAAAALAVCGLSVAIPRGVWFLGAAVLLLSGSLLFGADLSVRALSGTRLFPMAAPLGGILLIVGWISVTLAAGAVFWQTSGRTPGQNIDE